jgi:dienelactone hydrolase
LTILATGAELRRTGEGTAGTVVCVNGGQARDVEGTWSASVEWLVRRVAPRFPELSFAEVRYRVKSWRRLEWCVADALAAIDEAGGRTLLLGFSLGGAVGISAARHPAVEGVVGLAPWIPDQLDVSPLAGKRLVVVHGSLDRPLPGVPGVSPHLSRRGAERARAAGATTSYTLVAGGVHGLALRAPWGALLTLPRAARWAATVEDELRRFAAGR